MNKKIKIFIEVCSINTLLFFALISAEYLFKYEGSISAMLKGSELSKGIILISYLVSVLTLSNFIVNIKQKHLRELYFKGGVGYLELSSHSFFYNLINLYSRDLNKIRERLNLNGDFMPAFIDKLKQIDNGARGALEDVNVRDLLTQEKITFDQLNQVNYEVKRALRNDNIKALFIDNHISFYELNLCDHIVLEALDNQHIRTMFINGHLNLEQIRMCEYHVIRALDNLDVRNQLINDFRNQHINNGMTWYNFIRGIHRERANNLNENPILRAAIEEVFGNRNPGDRANNLNENPLLRAVRTNNLDLNTHQASVHESASDSAIALAERYDLNHPENLVIDRIDVLTNEINNFNLNERITNHIHEAAKRGLNRLRNSDFTDPKSNLTIPKLIALTHIAANDKEEQHSQDTYNDYLEAIIFALYESQRLNNFMGNVDRLDTNDSKICDSGTFNKIIEKMVSILPDCQIIVINFDIIAYKANQIVKNIITQFFDERTTLNLPNEAELMVLENNHLDTYINYLQDIINIHANHDSNPLCNALKDKLIQGTQSQLNNEFGSHLNRILGEMFTFLDLFDNAFSTNKDYIQLKLNNYIQAHPTHENSINGLSLFSETSHADGYQTEAHQSQPTL